MLSVVFRGTVASVRTLSEIDQKEVLLWNPYKNGRSSTSPVCRPPWSPTWDRVTAHNKNGFAVHVTQVAPTQMLYPRMGLD